LRADKSAFDIRWEEVNQIERLTGELEMDVESVSKLSSEEVPVQHPVNNPNRPKRGLANFIGYELR
jgi:hypothetical protein